MERLGALIALNNRPSFNCATARRPVEKAICANPEWANLDRQISAVNTRVVREATSDLRSAAVEGSAECVRMARPFLSRAKLLPGLGARVRSVCADGESGLLVCAENARSAWAVYRVGGREEKLAGAAVRGGGVGLR